MILSTIIKEVRLLLADKGAMASMFLLPIVFMAVFGYMFQGAGESSAGSQKTPVTKVALFLAEGQELGRGLVEHLESNPTLQVIREKTAEAVRSRVARNDPPVGLILDAGFDPPAKKPAEFCVDTARSPMELGALIGPLEGAFASAYYRVKYGAFLGSGGEGPALLERRPPPGTKKPVRMDSFQISVPGNAVLFAFFGALGIALSFFEERRTGTWRRLLASPVGRGTLLFAKLVPFLVVGLFQMVFFFTLGHLAFGMRIGGSLFALALLSLGLQAAVVGFGLLLASFGGTEKSIAGFGSIVILVMGLVGGCMMPRMFMPDTFKGIGRVTPHAWALDGFYDVLIYDGTTVQDVVPSILALFGFGALFTVLGMLQFRFERG